MCAEEAGRYRHGKLFLVSEKTLGTGGNKSWHARRGVNRAGLATRGRMEQHQRQNRVGLSQAREQGVTIYPSLNDVQLSEQLLLGHIELIG